MPIPKPSLTDLADEAALAAANAMAKVVQRHLNITNGDAASIFFSGEQLEVLTKMARKYYGCEVMWRQMDDVTTTLIKGFE